MAFLSEEEPPRGVPVYVLPGIDRVVARNPSVMTYHGTNTYLIRGLDGLTIIDPGPEDPQHVEDVLAATQGVPVERLLLTHTHADHLGAAPALSAATGAPIFGYKISAKPGFTPDRKLAGGDSAGSFIALHTPGHAADHLCFQYTPPGGAKILFSGDHVMSWSSSIVSPPDGDMLAYYRSLELLLGRDDEIYLGGHGPLLTDPRKLVTELLEHRKHREASMLEKLRQRSWAVAELAAELYHKTDIYLKAAAQRNVLSHMRKLEAEGIVRELEPSTTPHPDNAAMRPPDDVTAETGAQILAFHQDALRRFGMV